MSLRLGTYSGPTVPPAAMVATKAMASDPRAEPLFSERVPFVVSTACQLLCYLRVGEPWARNTHSAPPKRTFSHDSQQVVYGAPGSRLVDQAISPRELIESRGSLRLNATYYITKQVRTCSSSSSTCPIPVTSRRI